MIDFFFRKLYSLARGSLKESEEFLANGVESAPVMQVIPLARIPSAAATDKVLRLFMPRFQELPFVIRARVLRFTKTPANGEYFCPCVNTMR